MFKVIFKGLIKINAQTIDTGTLPYKFSMSRLIFAEEGNKWFRNTMHSMR